MLKKTIALAMLLIGVLSYAQSMYVISEDLNVRLSPSKYSKKTNVLLKGQGTDLQVFQYFLISCFFLPCVSNYLFNKHFM